MQAMRFFVDTHDCARQTFPPEQGLTRSARSSSTIDLQLAVSVG
jgi:hypothetical protein